MNEIEELRKYFIDDGGPREARQNALLDEALRMTWNARGVADAKLFEEDDDHRDIAERITTLDR